MFSTVMISDAILSVVLYVPPYAGAQLPRSAPFALQILRTLSHLSFIISRFGGVATTSSSSLLELKRVFYTALDVITADVSGQTAEAAVRELAYGDSFHAASPLYSILNSLRPRCNTETAASDLAGEEGLYSFLCRASHSGPQ